MWAFRLAVVLIPIVVGIVILWAIQRGLIYFPSGDPGSPADAGLPHAETVAIATHDGLTLGGWFVPASEPASGATVAIFNGNGGNRAMRAPLAAQLARHGIASLLFDYRGYGGNPGTPSEKGLASDARAVLRYLLSRRDVDGDRIAYFGESLGSGVAVGLAIERPPLALILRSPFTSLVDLGRVHYPFLPVSLVLRDRFPSLVRIATLESPLLVIATDKDDVVPTAQSERLYNAAASPKRFVIIEGTRHNDEEILGGRRVIAAIVEFLNGLSPQSPQSTQRLAEKIAND
jgi:fermentation-respiration switch protein FrsA (DUF1100 family)